ncbi:hypothetical protein [Amycolatopsis sp. NPDC051372]
MTAIGVVTPLSRGYPAAAGLVMVEWVGPALLGLASGVVQR